MTSSHIIEVLIFLGVCLPLCGIYSILLKIHSDMPKNETKKEKKEKTHQNGYTTNYTMKVK